MIQRVAPPIVYAPVRPIVHAPIRAGTPRYDALWLEHDPALAQHGIRIIPSDELIERARDHARRMHRTSGRPNAPETDEAGVDYVTSNFEGQIGAELFANYYDTVADWEIYPNRDPGFDVLLPRPARRPIQVDVKTRRGFLTSKLSRLSATADFYALVEHRPGEAHYTLGGVITAADFLVWQVPMHFRELQGGVTAAKLQGLRDFDPSQALVCER